MLTTGRMGRQWAPAGNSRQSRNIVTEYQLTKARVMQKVSASLGLIVAVLEQQPAARAQMFRRSADDTAKVREPVGTRGERRARLEAQVALSQVWVGCCNVRPGCHAQS